MADKIYNKLVRDKIPQIIEEHGGIVSSRMVSGAELRIALRRKLVEEAQELASAETRNNLVEELADMWEVIDAVIREEGVSHDEIEKARIKKLEERGGLKNGIFLEQVTENPGA